MISSTEIRSRTACSPVLTGCPALDDSATSGLSMVGRGDHRVDRAAKPDDALFGAFRAGRGEAQPERVAEAPARRQRRARDERDALDQRDLEQLLGIDAAG